MILEIADFSSQHSSIRDIYALRKIRDDHLRSLKPHPASLLDDCRPKNYRRAPRTSDQAAIDCAVYCLPKSCQATARQLHCYLPLHSNRATPGYFPQETNWRVHRVQKTVYFASRPSQRSLPNPEKPRSGTIKALVARLLTLSMLLSVPSSTPLSLPYDWLGSPGRSNGSPRG